MGNYTIGQMARMAGVSVRTLHHYDQIGLLQPQARTAAGYRLYGREDQLRLQQILFFRELDLPLNEIGAILDDPSFDLVRSLHKHRGRLQDRVERLTTLLETIDKTIRALEEDTMLTDEELYEGFSKEQIERYQREAREMYDPALVEESQRRVKRMSRAQWEQVKAEGDEVTRALAALADRAPSDPEVQELLGRHHAWIEHFYPCSSEVYAGLGQGYSEHPDFRAFYDRYRPGLADFLAEAIKLYADEVLAARVR